MKRFLLTASAGAAAGTVNAFLCLKGIPVPVPETTFKPDIVLAGAIHGAVLAGTVHCLASFFYFRRPAVRFWGLVLAGYLTGWLSFVPIRLSITERWTPASLVEALGWPGASGLLQGIGSAYVFFGLVGVIYFFCLVILRLLESPRLTVHLAAALLAGVLGSLPWWVEFKPWYFSLIHGTVWGLLVGAASWASPKPKGLETA